MTMKEPVQMSAAGFSASELSTFRRWFTHFDVSAWEARAEADALTLESDRPAETMRTEYRRDELGKGIRGKYFKNP